MPGVYTTSSLMHQRLGEAVKTLEMAAMCPAADLLHHAKDLLALSMFSSAAMLVHTHQVLAIQLQQTHNTIARSSVTLLSLAYQT